MKTIDRKFTFKMTWMSLLTFQVDLKVDCRLIRSIVFSNRLKTAIEPSQYPNIDQKSIQNWRKYSTGIELDSFKWLNWFTRAEKLRWFKLAQIGWIQSETPGTDQIQSKWFNQIIIKISQDWLESPQFNQNGPKNMKQFKNLLSNAVIKIKLTKIGDMKMIINWSKTTKWLKYWSKLMEIDNKMLLIIFKTVKFWLKLVKMDKIQLEWK